jgi:hypothetical protein
VAFATHSKKCCETKIQSPQKIRDKVYPAQQDLHGIEAFTLYFHKRSQEWKNSSTSLGQGGPKIMHAYTAALTLQFKKQKWLKCQSYL